ncbi:MAG: hypothetical protein ABJE95_11140 [Byssovorax sp.]
MRIHGSLKALAVIGTLAGVASCSLVLGIGDPTLDPAGSSGSTGGSGSGTTASQSSGATSTSAAGTGGGEPTYPCTPTDPSCSVVKSDCLAVYDNTAKPAFAIRVAQLDFYQPVAFTGTLEQAAFLASIAMNLPKCNLKGSGTFSWIVNIDKTTGKYLIGAAKPPKDPHDGYSYVNETITLSGQSFPIAPVGGAVTLDADGTIHPDPIENILLPAYLDAQATNLILVPLHKVRVLETKVSADQNCVGSYNAAGLKTVNGCLPDVNKGISSFVIGGKIDGFIDLEEADNIIITSFGLNRSLCVLLSNSAGTYGDGGNPAKCKRDGVGKIKFNGDWCGATNLPADATCYSAVAFFAGFAGSGVELK